MDALRNPGLGVSRVRGMVAVFSIVARCTTFLVSYDSIDFRSNGVDMASHARVIMAVQARSHV